MLKLNGGTEGWVYQRAGQQWTGRKEGTRELGRRRDEEGSPSQKLQNKTGKGLEMMMTAKAFPKRTEDNLMLKMCIICPELCRGIRSGRSFTVSRGVRCVLVMQTSGHAPLSRRLGTCRIHTPSGHTPLSWRLGTCIHMPSGHSPLSRSLGMCRIPTPSGHTPLSRSLGCASTHRPARHAPWQLNSP